MIRLTEYQPTTVDLSRDEADELTALTKGGRGAAGQPRVIERLTINGDDYDVTPGPYAGRFSLRSGRVVEIISRFAFDDLTRLLGLGDRATLLREAATAATGGNGLMDLIAMAFTREVERIVGQGLEKGYRTQTFTRPPFGGVPAVTAHLNTHAGRPDRLVTTARRLTTDVPINRLVAAAHRQIAALSYQDRGLATRLRALGASLHQISPLTGPATPIPAVASRYREAHDLALLILEGRTSLPTASGVAGVGVLFNMTRIWERYVEAWLATRYAMGEVIRSQHRIQLTDSHPTWEGRADFVVKAGGRPTAVYDAKYREWHARPATSELYQLLAYTSRLGVRYAALLHPATSTAKATFRVGDTTIETIAIDITGGG
ncbi:5-methylcytosine restriction system specificity protein McrC [Phytohabitans sp. LJ34]|uniref:5-methylcytosine restriction system specificity protein McrC n=1 Tax=Phytohabitans sp. LJ34 TaxID=3452217 RepID=UPI003F8AAD61